MKGTRRAKTLWVASMVAVAASACAAGESSDDEEIRAIAQAPAQADEAERAEEPMEPGAEQQEDAAAVESSVITGPADEALAHPGECEGRTTTFEIDHGELVVGVCCSSGAGCETQLTFAGSGDHLVVEGQALDEIQFSPRANWLIISTAASSTDGTALGVVAVDDLRALAGPVDQAPVGLGMDDLEQAVSWKLRADALHRFERLSARAGDEAARHCEEGFHLPTLIELAADATPYSQWLELTFDGWTDDERLMATSITDDGGRTVLYVDLTTECMERYDAR